MWSRNLLRTCEPAPQRCFGGFFGIVIGSGLFRLGAALIFGFVGDESLEPTGGAVRLERIGGWWMTRKQTDYGSEVRDAVVKSSVTGVAATVLAVTIFSPSVLGGMIGTSLASASGAPNTSANNPYAHLPPYPTPLTGEDLAEVETNLAHATAQIALARAETDHKIDHLRTIAASAPTSTQVAPSVGAGFVLAGRASPTSAAAESTTLSAERDLDAPAIEALPSLENYAVALDALAYRDRHVELASLLLAEGAF